MTEEEQVEGKVKWLQDIGVGIAAVIATVSQVKRWWG